VEELPRSWQFDWTHLVLPVEPEYAFDAPSQAWLVNWFVWSTALLAVAWLAVGSASCFVPRATPEGARTPALLVATLAGVAGTSLLSYWREELIFTWPLALCAVFHAAAMELPLTRRKLDRAVQRRSLLAGVVILTSGLAYFWLCRRLSLVFEWAFLAGYAPALAAVLLDHWVASQTWPKAAKLLALATASRLGFALF
jgi:hypothetical protein